MLTLPRETRWATSGSAVIGRASVSADLVTPPSRPMRARAGHVTRRSWSPCVPTTGIWRHRTEICFSQSRLHTRRGGVLFLVQWMFLCDALMQGSTIRHLNKKNLPDPFIRVFVFLRCDYFWRLRINKKLPNMKQEPVLRSSADSRYANSPTVTWLAPSQVRVIGLLAVS